MRARNWLITLVGVTVSLAGCVSTSSNTATPSTVSSATTSAVAQAVTLPTLLPGQLEIDGDTGTMTPAEKPKFDASGADVLVKESFHGAAQAYSELCSGQTDMVDSTTKITAKQELACQHAGLKVVQFTLAADGDVVTIENDSDVGGDCLTTTQLQTIFRAGSPTLQWSQLGAGYLGVPLSTGGVGLGSAGFTLFDQAVLGSARPSLLDLRSDFHSFKTDDAARAWLVPAFTGRGVAANGRLAYFPFSYYTLYEEQLRPFELTLPGKQNCIFPSQQTLLSGEYPLSQQYLITTTTRSLERTEEKLFLSHYLKDASSLAQKRELAQLPSTTLQTELGWVTDTDTAPLLGPAATPTATPSPSDTNRPAS
ncbi:hypothetical protein [Jatrophihabitans sp.]|uniref:hypothetical protein n=1 Tax=Jatrophihabitans sp. TaxID=1932789 RepID=UPI0030C6893A|nr:phosphate transporter substrate-binding protein PhoT family [Jatrophihabitans sp.]